MATITVESWDLGTHDHLLKALVHSKDQPWLRLSFYIDYDGDGRSDIFWIDLVSISVGENFAFMYGAKHIWTHGNFTPNEIAKQIVKYVESLNTGNREDNLELLRGLLTWEFEKANFVDFNKSLEIFRARRDTKT